MRIALRSASSASREAELRQVDLAVDQAAVERAGHGGRLLVDLLEHERLVAGAVGRLAGDVDRLRLAGDRSAVRVEDLDALGAQDDELAVLHEQQLVGRVRERGDRRRDELLAVAGADHQRRLAARADEEAGLVGAHRDEREVAVELGVRGADGLDEVALVERADELRDGLGIGLRRELAAAGLERRAQLGVVLDDAVEDDLDAARGVVVGVGVGLAHAAVGGPAGVADAGRRRGRRVAAARAGESRHAVGARDGGAQAREVADRAHAVEAAVALEGDARGVVAAVLQGGQAVEQQRLGGAMADVSDDSAHGGGVRSFSGGVSGCC